MSLSINDLRALTEEQLIAFHDQAAVHTVVGTDYWMDELHRRDQMRAIAASTALARQSYWLTIANTLLALVAVVIALAK
jgi:hypothetical protein